MLKNKNTDLLIFLCDLNEEFIAFSPFKKNGLQIIYFY